jgi:stearoyl-CoA desaturase (delta-9 desaturase)
MSQLASTRHAAPNKQAPIPERDILASRLAYLTVGIPTLGTVAAVAYAISDGLWLSDVLLFLAMYLITGLGVEGGLHRYFTHRAFVASEPVKVFLAVAGSMAAQGPVIFWVANHRLHHAFADTDRDPHSPQPQEPGVRGRIKGLWHGHIGWLFTVNKIDWSRHTRD